MVEQFPSDWLTSRDTVEAALKTELQRILGDTAEQLDGPVRHISNRLVVAARHQRADIVAECRDQLAIELEQRKLRTASALGKGLEFVATTGLNLLFNGLVAGIAGMKVKP